MPKRIFALDIGTRTVTGMIMQTKHNNTFDLIDYCVKEHEERSMLDGQIHHVLEVSEVIQSVKSQLETKHGPLDKVSVAAAGRSLKTARAKAELRLNERP